MASEMRPVSSGKPDRPFKVITLHSTLQPTRSAKGAGLLSHSKTDAIVGPCSGALPHQLLYIAVRVKLPDGRRNHRIALIPRPPLPPAARPLHLHQPEPRAPPVLLSRVPPATACECEEESAKVRVPFAPGHWALSSLHRCRAVVALSLFCFSRIRGTGSLVTASQLCVIVDNVQLVHLLISKAESPLQHSTCRYSLDRIVRINRTVRIGRPLTSSLEPLS